MLVPYQLFLDKEYITTNKKDQGLTAPRGPRRDWLVESGLRARLQGSPGES